MWGFAIHPPRMIEAAPKHDEFFASDVRDSAHALIRELTQNSGDAALEAAGEVRLSFQFKKIEAKLFRDRYLAGLKGRPSFAAHLAASGLRGTSVLDGEEEVPLLVVEDFGTTGLTGPYDQESEKSSFLAFWKRYGTSNKGEESGGRHGIGKSVVPYSSRIRAFFGLTRRHDDGKELLMGQVVLRPHRIDGVVYDSYGQYSPSKDDEWALPYDNHLVQQAKEDMQLQRTDEPGLSLVVPYPLEEITRDGLIRAAVEHCFHQILSGHLRLEIDDIVLSKDTLLPLVSTHGDPRLQAAAELSAEVTATDKKLRLFEPKEGALRNRLTVEHFAEEDITKMRDLFREGKTVAVRLPVEIRPKEGPSQIGDVYLYLRRAGDANAARETYVRGRVTVPGQGRVLLGASALGLLVADHGPASRFLGDSEGVSHVKWVMNKLRDKYKNVENSFHPIRYGLGDLQKLLTDETEDRHIKDALKQFFWQPKPPEDKPDEVIINEDFPELDTGSAALDVRRIAGGFEIVREGAEARLNAIVEVAYAVRRGAPKWNLADFRLGDSVQVVQKGAGVVTFDANRLRIAGAANDFRLTVKGFDPNRDLVIRVAADDANEEVIGNED